MSYAENPYRPTQFSFAAQAAADERADFIRKTYLHLTGAVFAFAAIEFVLLQIPGIQNVAVLAGSGWNWAIVLGAFLVVSWLANTWAHSATSPTMQYMGLSLYVVAEAAIFLPLLIVANTFAPGVIPAAAISTLLVFGGLTAIVFITGADFSFLRNVLLLGGLAAFAFILGSIFMGFSLGLVFSCAMIALAGGYVLYDTSNVLHHYRIGQHVAASLALFASAALMFWYMIRLFMALSED